MSKKVFEELILGNPLDESTNIGPIAMPEGPELLLEMC